LVLLATEHALYTIKDAETGQRGYLLTGSDAYLEPYHSALDSLRADTADLRALTLGNATQQRQLDSLAQLIRPKLIELDRTIFLRRQGKVAEALRIVASGEGRVTMDGIRRVLGNLQAEEL